MSDFRDIDYRPTFPHIVSTPGILGGRWRIEGHRISTETIADLVDAEKRNITAVAEWYEIDEELVLEAYAFERSMAGALVRLRAAVAHLGREVAKAAPKAMADLVLIAAGGMAFTVLHRGTTIGPEEIIGSVITFVLICGLAGVVRAVSRD